MQKICSLSKEAIMRAESDLIIVRTHLLKAFDMLLLFGPGWNGSNMHSPAVCIQNALNILQQLSGCFGPLGGIRAFINFHKDEENNDDDDV